jgi:hypothetical protein
MQRLALALLTALALGATSAAADDVLADANATALAAADAVVVVAADAAVAASAARYASDPADGAPITSAKLDDDDLSQVWFGLDDDELLGWVFFLLSFTAFNSGTVGDSVGVPAQH